MTKKVALVQSNYIPWKGYFDLINMADEFILFDDMQYTRRDWRNRNRIKSPQGTIWLTIPVEVKGKYFQKINETLISDPEWNVLHWKTILHNYSRAESFHLYRGLFEDLYLGTREKFLSQVNHKFLVEICRILGINTRITWSSDYHVAEGKTERIVELCKQTGATEYISGPTARGYIDEELFRTEGIVLSYANYADYPEHRQLFPPFEHRVSILDLIFNEGPNAPRFLKSF